MSMASVTTMLTNARTCTMSFFRTHPTGTARQPPLEQQVEGRPHSAERMTTQVSPYEE